MKAFAVHYTVQYTYIIQCINADIIFRLPLFIYVTLHLWFSDIWVVSVSLKLFQMKSCEKCPWVAVLHALSHLVRRLSHLPLSESSLSLYSSVKCPSFSPLTSDPHVTAVYSTQTTGFTDRIQRGSLGHTVFSKQWTSWISEVSFHHQFHCHQCIHVNLLGVTVVL